MKESKTYEGYTNYETWAVNLWLNNEEGTHRYWREEAGRVRDRGKLAQRLKDELNEEAPDLGSTLWADLLNAALSDVDWYEVAESFLEGVTDDEEEESRRRMTRIRDRPRPNWPGSFPSARLWPPPTPWSSSSPRRSPDS